MPIRAVKTIVKKLSKHYYDYGKFATSRTYLLLLFSLSFISYFSLPIISKYFHNVVSSNSNIPLSHISTSLDSQCWHASAHVQFNNFTLDRQPPTTYLITEQIRLSHADRPVTFNLIQRAKQIYESIATTTTVVNMDRNSVPVSLATICYKHRGHCLVHAPPFSQFEDESDWKSKTSVRHHSEYDTHPYSIYSNATFDSNGKFIKADAVLLTFVLNQTQHGNTLLIWNKILEEVKLKFNILDSQQGGGESFIWSASSNTLPQMIQYKFDLLPYDISYKVQVSIVVYVTIFFLVSYAFGKSNLVKSGYTFGLASVFLSIACFTTTWGIFDKLGVSFHSVPWYLLLFIVNIGSLENVFLLANAVLDAGCDMIVKEKINRGLQSVGVPMTATLTAELLILHVGSQMDADLIKEFCVFAKVALLVDYLLEMTFTIAILSIDIKRVELADLDDRQMSKRLHELSTFEFEKERQQPDFCPIQDTKNKEDSKSCAECKDFKTHRVYNSFMLCLIVLILSLFCTKGTHNHASPNALERQSDVFRYQPDLSQLSDQFWSIVNPQKDITWLQIQPPQLFIYDTDVKQVQEHILHLQHLYQIKTMTVRYQSSQRSSLFRMFILSVLQNAFVFILSINIPIFILCLVMICIITWMTPKWRKQWLVPLLIRCFNQMVLAIIRWFHLKRFYYVYIKGQTYDSVSKEYDADGIHHRGAITVQNIFNLQQYRSNVKTVQIRTLTSQHISDIQSMDSNANQNLVSCGQDGRIVLWNANPERATWAARLDRLFSIRGGVLQATLNPLVFSFDSKKTSPNKKSAFHQYHNQQQQRKRSNNQTMTTLSNSYHSKARCVKIDQGNKWAAAGYDNGVIRVWNVNSGVLFREMVIVPPVPSVEVQQESSNHVLNASVTATQNLRHRFNNAAPSSPPSYASTTPTKKHPRRTDHILFIQFIGVIAEYCHPLIAEAAARCRASDIEDSQNFIISAHKSGMIHEWDILSGECIQTLRTGHTKDITQLHVVESKAPHRKFGVTWVFTASRDGTVKCWERCLVTKHASELEDDNDRQQQEQQQRTRWQLAYTIQHKHPVTSLATEVPVGGMGILVTGCSDGSVQVWNFETGESVCSLSQGKPKPTTASELFGVDANVGGPIRKFSKFPSYITPQLMSDSEDDEEEEDDASGRVSDHSGAIYQVTVTRYCEVENGPGLCRGCDTCFGNGFLVASSSMDNKVHAWRLERSDSGHEGTCTLCTKDYHRKQYKHRKASVSNTSEDGNVGDILLKSSSSSVVAATAITGTVSSRRKKTSHGNSPAATVKKRLRTISNKEDTLELLDIEQLAGDTHILLKPSFLGKIDQPAGHGVVFCDKILAGVRRRRNHQQPHSNRKHGEWEAWFASLQYYDPSVSHEDGQTRHVKIPLETFVLDEPHQVTTQKEKEESQPYSSQTFKNTLLSLFSSSSLSSGPGEVAKDQLKYKGIHAHTAYNSLDDDVKKLEEDEDEMEEDMLEASENLPFSAVRHIIPLDGSGLACDFGNFIKLVYLDKPSLTEKERLKQLRVDMDDHKARPRMVVQEDVKQDSKSDKKSKSGGGHADCQCGNEGQECSPATKGKNGCCGGVNKEKNGGQCCGESVKQKQQAIRNQKLLLKKKAVNNCAGLSSLAECSLKNNCSRAAECVSSNQAFASSISTSSFNNWL
ncbi:MAG: hypothetical protein EXX96DRAFT_497661 [Benjaminiella poitrasii]|nr:MAG: hypothetical protein EXX96DRAFT_497661 [Benjaminiella poitrasii]